MRQGLRRVLLQAFRHMTPDIQETDEQREVRERKEFFYSLPLSEQRRFIDMLGLVFRDCAPGVYELELAKKAAVA